MITESGTIEQFPVNCDAMPLVIVQRTGIIVLQLNTSLSQIKNQMDVTLHQLDGQEICLLSSVEHNKPIWFQCS